MLISLFLLLHANSTRVTAEGNFSDDSDENELTHSDHSADISVPPMDRAFNEHAFNWEQDEKRFISGFQKAEAFRLLLLDTNVVAIGDTLEDFRKKVAPPEERRDLSRFQVTTSSFIDQLRGNQVLNPADSFGPFSGKWYGQWDGRKVDHNWGPHHESALLSIPAKRLGLQVKVFSQYAWIGDGFGWNYLAKSKRNQGNVVLGYVYHLKAYQPETIAFEFPLVGYSDGPGRLIWVTPKFVFFEEAYNNDSSITADINATHYSITGFEYVVSKNKNGGSLKPIMLNRKVFQTTYTRDINHRPQWIEFDSP